MENLIGTEGDNLGGNEEFYFIPVDDVVAIPRAISNRVLDPITLGEDLNFYKGKGVIETLGGDMEHKAITQGNTFLHQFSAFIKGDDATHGAQMEEMTYYRFIVIRKDRNGYYKLLGGMDYPLRFTYKLISGNETQQLKGYQVTFSVTSEFPEYFYQGAFSTYEDVVQENINLSLYTCDTLNDPTNGISDGQVSNCLIPDRDLEVTEAGIVQSDFEMELYNKAAIYLQRSPFSIL